MNQQMGNNVVQFVSNNDQDSTLNEPDLNLEDESSNLESTHPGSGTRRRKKGRTAERSASYRGQLLNRWPRAFARIFDLAWQLAVVITALVMIFFKDSASLFDLGNPVLYFLLFVSLPLALLLDALIAGLLGNAPAKALIGVKPTTSRGENLGFAKHLKRNYGVWTDGFAMGLLPLTLFTFIRQFKRISGRREAIYDERLHARVRTGKLTTARVFLPLLVLLSVPLVLASDLSLAKLVDNFSANQESSPASAADTVSPVTD